MSGITLDGITLNTSMVWVERYQSKKVVQNVRDTLGGVPVVFVGTKDAGFPITLRAGDDYGWLTRSVVNQIMARADEAGAVYVLSFNDVEYSVIFRHNDAPAVDMQPMIPRTGDSDDDYFIGDIKLLTV